MEEEYSDSLSISTLGICEIKYFYYIEKAMKIRFGIYSFAVSAL